MTSAATMPAEPIRGPALPGERAPGRLVRVLVAVAIAASVAILFRGVLRHEFLGWDDLTNVPRNPWLRPLSPANLVHFWRHPYEGLYVPLTYNVWAVVAALAAVPADPVHQPLGLDPAWFHRLNVALHAVAAMLVFAILWRLFGSLSGAALGAMLFAWHPLQVEPVAWITGLKDLLSAVLALGAIALYLRSLEPRRAPGEAATRVRGAIGRRSVLLQVVATVLYVLALLAKPGVVTLPAVVWVLQVGLLRQRWNRNWPMLALWLVVAGVLAWVNKSQQATGVVLDVAPLATRPLIATDALAHYAYKLFWPWQLGPDYGRSPSRVIAHGWLYWTWLLPAALVALAAWSSLRREMFVALAVFVLTVLPVLGLVPFAFQYISTVGDRYAYLGLLAPAIVVAAWARRGRSYGLVAACAVVLALLFWQSQRQTAHWHNGITLFRHALTVHPLSFVARQNLGFDLQQQGHGVEAERLFLEAITLRPQYPEALKTLGNVYYNRGQYDAAIARYHEVLEFRPQDVEAHFNLGNAFTKQNDYVSAIGAYRRAIAPGRRYERDPRVYFNLGIALLHVNQPAEAAAQFLHAMELVPPQMRVPFDVEAYYRAGQALAACGRRDEARGALLKAQALAPEAIEVRQLLEQLETAP